MDFFFQGSSPWGGRISELFWRSHLNIWPPTKTLWGMLWNQNISFSNIQWETFPKCLSYTIPSGNLQKSHDLCWERQLITCFYNLSTEWLRVRSCVWHWGGEGRRWGFLGPTWQVDSQSWPQLPFQGLFMAEASPRLCDRCHFPAWTQPQGSPVNLCPKWPQDK